MSNRKGGKSKAIPVKPTKKSSQAAKKASNAGPYCKTGNICSPKKWNAGVKFDPEHSAIRPDKKLEGRGGKKKVKPGKRAVGPRSASTQVSYEPLTCALKQTSSETAASPPAFFPNPQATQQLQSSATPITNLNTTYDVYNQWDQIPELCRFIPSTAKRERDQPDVGAQVKEAIASGLAQTNAAFLQKMDMLQDVIEINNRKTERAVGQVCSSVNKVKVNLELVDSTLETMSSRLLEFQQGVKTGLEELTKEVGNLASSLRGNGADYQVCLDSDAKH